MSQDIGTIFTYISYTKYIYEIFEIYSPYIYISINTARVTKSMKLENISGFRNCIYIYIIHGYIYIWAVDFGRRHFSQYLSSHELSGIGNCVQELNILHICQMYIYTFGLDFGGTLYNQHFSSHELSEIRLSQALGTIFTYILYIHTYGNKTFLSILLESRIQ